MQGFVRVGVSPPPLPLELFVNLPVEALIESQKPKER